MFIIKLKRVLRRCESFLLPKTKQQKTDFLIRFKAQNLYPAVLSVEGTVEELIQKKISISRFGDGEFYLCLGRSIGFQEYDKDLRMRLQEIIRDSENEFCMVALPEFRTHSLTDFWIDFWYENVCDISQLVNKSGRYGNAAITRKTSVELMKKLSGIWENRNVIFVTGQGSRFDAGHELFKNIKSSKAIFSLSKNAWSDYFDLLPKVTQELQNTDNPVVLISLGPTASVLAYDIAQLGFQALDIGHITNVWDTLNNKAESAESLPVKS